MTLFEQVGGGERFDDDGEDFPILDQARALERMAVSGTKYAVCDVQGEAARPASRNLSSDDPMTQFKGTRQFVQASFERQPAVEELEALTLASMQTPLYVRRQLVRRGLDYEEALRAVRVPTLVVQGERDGIVAPAVGEYTHALIAGSRFALYPAAGHSPFAEEPRRFNIELDAFMSASGLSSNS